MPNQMDEQRMPDATIIRALRDHDSPAWRVWEQDGFWRAVLAAADRLEALGAEVAEQDKRLKWFQEGFAAATAERDQWQKRAADAECDIEHLARGECSICALCEKVGKSPDDACIYGCYITEKGERYFFGDPDEPCDRFEYRINGRGPCTENAMQTAQGAPFDEPRGGDEG